MTKPSEETLKKIIQSSIKETFDKSGKFPVKKKALPIIEKKKDVKTVKEAVHVTPDTFLLKTDKLSKVSKEAHENLYKNHVDTLNKVSSELDALNRQEANSFSSGYRSYKMDEANNLNAVKLHELYFANISDMSSEISVDSIPYIKLSRYFGTFENWQFDFMACAMSSREGWVMTTYDPFSNVYRNVCVDGNNIGVPVSSIPILVIDMFSHAYYKDYDLDKRSYLMAMMREINWDVVEARMALVEKCDLAALYEIKPIYNNKPDDMLSAAEKASQPPINQINTGTQQVSPTAPAAPMPPGLQENKK